MASYLYIPGLALAGTGGRADDVGSFRAKIARVFGTFDAYRPHVGDEYITEMFETLVGKGVTPVDCGATLRWVQISGMGARPGRAYESKAMYRLGAHKDNVLGREPGAKPAPIKTYVGWGVGMVACTAPEYLGQPGLAIDDDPGGPLSDVDLRDTLYIVGHSGVNGNALSYKYAPAGHAVSARPGDGGCTAATHVAKRHVDAVTLASLLVAEGLRPGVPFDIAVAACFAGGLEDEALQTVQPYAQRLAGALSARGFLCRVYGAKGLTSTKTVSGHKEVHVAPGVTLHPGADPSIELEPGSAQALRDEGGQPFYKRFFRMFG